MDDTGNDAAQGAANAGDPTAAQSRPAPHAEPSASANSLSLQRPMIIAALYLINIMFGFTVFVGVILAYVWRAEDQAQDWEKTHYTYLIRTFWTGIAAGILGFLMWIGSFMAVIINEDFGSKSGPTQSFLPAFIMLGLMLILFCIAIWFCVRCILSIIRATKCEPMPKPKTWLF